MMVKLFFLEKLSLTFIKILILFINLFFFSNANSESYVKAGESLIWDSENQNYTANGNVEFKNDQNKSLATIAGHGV